MTDFYLSTIKFIRESAKYNKEQDIKFFTEYINTVINFYNDADKNRHMYSIISKIIHDCVSVENKTEENHAILNSIVMNIELLQQIFISQNKNIKKFDVVNEKLIKFVDHVNLEVVRLLYISQFNNKVSENIEMLNRAKQTADSANEKITEANKKTDSMYSQLIAILGIFSAVILVFFGDFAFFTSVFNNINAISKYRLVFLAALVGFVVFNTTFALLFYIGKLLNKNILSKCNSNEGGSCCEKKCNKFFVSIKRLPLVFWCNVIIISIMLGSTIAYIYK